MKAIDSSTPALQLHNLSKTFKVHERQPGVVAALRSIFRRSWKVVEAVKDLSFEVEQGAIIGFLGPNGAGKTTTIKMLSGLLYPSGGQVRVLGYNPWKREKQYLKRITLIMGRRNQMIWDVPAIESYEFFRAIYGIPRPEYKQTLDELIDLLELGPLVNKPLRNLSLGERMKCELTGALLHRPAVLYLDEPTIGLDVVAQHRFRKYIAEYNRKYNATVLLTSHYMGDVEELCKRVIFIDKGKLVFDGSLNGLVERFLPYKMVQLRIGYTNGNGSTDLAGYGEVVSEADGRVTLRIPKADAPRVISNLMADLPIEDMSVIDPPITDVVRHIYADSAML